jgi:hypothetical protein
MISSEYINTEEVWERENAKSDAEQLWAVKTQLNMEELCAVTKQRNREELCAVTKQDGEEL